MAPPAIPSPLRFGSFLIYAPNGKTPNALRSKNVVRKVKNDKGNTIAGTVDQLRKQFQGSVLQGLLGPNVALVPTPRSYPIREGALWPAKRVCEELVRVGLGSEVVPCLSRVKIVQKSAVAPAGARPKVAEHVASIEGSPMLRRFSRLVVVDEVVTSGSTLLASAAHLRQLFPEAEISAFSLIRTMSNLEDLETMYVPAVGEIRLSPGRETARRDP